MNMLTEIMEEYKRDCLNEQMCTLRSIAVQSIKKDAYQDIEFYQEQISRKLQGQKVIHGAQEAQTLLDSVISEFYEYQLASYLYAYTSFMEVILQKNLDAALVVAERLAGCAQKYNKLYNDCFSQITNYQRTAIETQFLGGLGNVTKAIGQTLAAVPVLNKSSVDEALIHAGELLGKHTQDTTARHLEKFAPLADSRMGIFIDNVRQLNLLYTRTDAMITNGENLYILEVP